MDNEKFNQEEDVLIEKMVEINKLMPPPVTIAEPFVDRFYNQFNFIISGLL